MQEEENMNNKNTNASEFTRKYDSAYMEILATEMRREDAREFKKLVEKEGTTVGKKLSGFVRTQLAENGKTQTYVPAVLTAKNADRLKNETAHHNPKNLNPDQLMNDILERYFKWLDEARA